MVSQIPNYVISFARHQGYFPTTTTKWFCQSFIFFLSKGVIHSNIVNLVSKNPIVLSPSLENHIVPTHELLYRFMKSDKETIAPVIKKQYLLSSHLVSYKIKMLVDIGATDSNIARLLELQNTFSRLLQTNKMPKLVKDFKNSGFNPSKTIFCLAVLAIENKPAWKEKVDVYKKWGWSDEDVNEAFRKQPLCMLTSIDKINSVMNFWVNQLGWDARAIAKAPHILPLNLEKRIIPRSPVVQFLLENDPRKKIASLTYPFVVSEKYFRDVYLKPL